MCDRNMQESPFRSMFLNLSNFTMFGFQLPESPQPVIREFHELKSTCFKAVRLRITDLDNGSYIFPPSIFLTLQLLLTDIITIDIFLVLSAMWEESASFSVTLGYCIFIKLIVFFSKIGAWMWKEWNSLWSHRALDLPNSSSCCKTSYLIGNAKYGHSLLFNLEFYLSVSL